MVRWMASSIQYLLNIPCCLCLGC
ncbi:hypothetical protein Gotri_019602 [Gossypium trilobum]|uniref:Uncharacterized protein n=2 Tax=Gossypium TaxID=3633 RepID=A0A7J9EDK4_9ROSI|nr:hypothetical protein [Gossypium lobatum]MBA0771077.1 hypothetical protein [Gossypium trilobum]